MKSGPVNPSVNEHGAGYSLRQAPLAPLFPARSSGPAACHRARGRRQHEAPASHRPATGIELLDVHGAAGSEPVSRARFAADHLELTTAQPLSVLLRCEPGSQKRNRFSLGLATRIGKPKLIKLAQDCRGDDRARYGRRKKECPVGHPPTSLGMNNVS